MANSIAGDSEASDLKCRRSYATSTIKSMPKKDTKALRTAILIVHYCTMWTAAYLILPSQPQSQSPVRYHWTSNSRASLSSNPPVLWSHHRLPVYSCLVKALCVIQPTDTPGEVLLLHHTLPALTCFLLELPSEGHWGSQLTPAEMKNWDGHRRSGDAKMGRRFMPPPRAITLTFSLILCHLFQLQSPNQFNSRKQISGSVLLISFSPVSWVVTAITICSDILGLTYFS